MYIEVDERGLSRRCFTTRAKAEEAIKGKEGYTVFDTASGSTVEDYGPSDAEMREDYFAEQHNEQMEADWQNQF